MGRNHVVRFDRSKIAKRFLWNCGERVDLLTVNVLCPDRGRSENLLPHTRGTLLINDRNEMVSAPQRKNLLEGTNPAKKQKTNKQPNWRTEQTSPLTHRLAYNKQRIGSFLGNDPEQILLLIKMVMVGGILQKCFFWNTRVDTKSIKVCQTFFNLQKFTSRWVLKIQISVLFVCAFCGRRCGWYPRHLAKRGWVRRSWKYRDSFVLFFCFLK